MSFDGQPRFELPQPMDPKKLYGVQSKGPQYVDYTKKAGRSTESEMFFYTGLSWLGGMIGGSAYGLKEGWTTASAPTTRIRINSIMNAMSKHGNIYATQLGSAMFVYQLSSICVKELPAMTGADKFIPRLDDQVGLPLASGFVAGSIFKSARGTRAAILAGCIGAGLSLGFKQAQGTMYRR
jgi:mitochondrial import inner membrane translocase subunit TIM23